MRKTRFGGALSFARYSSVAALLGVSLVLAACYPGDVTSISELDLVGTLYNKDAAWGTFQTYAMPDTVIAVVAEDQDSLPVEITPETHDLILAEVASQMAAMGYTRIPEEELSGDNLPDVVVLLQYTSSETWVLWQSYGWWDYWGWWPGWGYYPPSWGPGWGWYYPPGCCVSGVSKYLSGSIFIDMVDPINPLSEEETVPVYWSAGMNGLITSSGTGTRITNAIRQAFAQSPYLEVQN